MATKITNNREMTTASLNWTFKRFFSSVTIHMCLQRTWSSEPFLTNITLVPLWSGRYGLRTEGGHHGLRRWDRWRPLLSWWWLWSVPIWARWQSQVITIGVPCHRDRVILWRWWQSWRKAGPVMVHAISIITYRSCSSFISRSKVSRSGWCCRCGIRSWSICCRSGRICFVTSMTSTNSHRFGIM